MATKRKAFPKTPKIRTHSSVKIFDGETFAYRSRKSRGDR
jgi:hypothetical protein